MNAKANELSGHAKEVAGIVTGDDALKAEGRDQRVHAEIDSSLDDAAKKVDAGIGATQDKVDGLFHRLSRWVRRS